MQEHQGETTRREGVLSKPSGPAAARRRDGRGEADPMAALSEGLLKNKLVLRCTSVIERIRKTRNYEPTNGRPT